MANSLGGRRARFTYELARTLVEPGTVERLDELADRHGTSRAHEVRAALRAYLASAEPADDAVRH